MLPEENYEFRIDDLEQLATKFVGDDDNIFEENEQILFFGQNPNIWFYDLESNHYKHSQNIYSNYTYYFLTINNNPTKNIQIQSISNTEILSFPIEKQNYVSSFVDYNFHESENYNLVSTGQQWFGEYFGSNSLYSFDLAEGEILDSISFRARVQQGLQLIQNSILNLIIKQHSLL